MATLVETWESCVPRYRTYFPLYNLVGITFSLLGIWLSLLMWQVKWLRGASLCLSLLEMSVNVRWQGSGSSVFSCHMYTQLFSCQKTRWILYIPSFSSNDLFGCSFRGHLASWLVRMVALVTQTATGVNHVMRTNVNCVRTETGMTYVHSVLLVVTSW